MLPCMSHTNTDEGCAAWQAPVAVSRSPLTALHVQALASRDMTICRTLGPLYLP